MGTRLSDEDLVPKEEGTDLGGTQHIGADGSVVRSGANQGADGDLYPEQDEESSRTKGPSEN